jgi:hypothetical protein
MELVREVLTSTRSRSTAVQIGSEPQEFLPIAGPEARAMSGPSSDLDDFDRQTLLQHGQVVPVLGVFGPV